MEPAVRIVVDEEEPGKNRSHPRWLLASIPVLTVGLLLVSALVLRSGDLPVRAGSGTVIVDVYLADDVGSSEMEQMLDRLGAEATVLDRRIVRPSPLGKVRVPPKECDGTVAIRLLVANVQDATAIAQLTVEWYPYPDSGLGAIGTQHGDMSSPLMLHCRDVGQPSPSPLLAP